MNREEYDLYVDAASSLSEETGSRFQPFKTIGAALSHIEEENLEDQDVYIEDGTYTESIDFINDASLFGESKDGTIIDAEGHKYGIYFRSTKSEVRNLTIENATTNIRVNKRSRASIYDCTIKNADKNGVEVDRSSDTKKYKFRLRDCKVKGSVKRGLYIFKRRIEITESEIAGNKEEGIDLHASMRGSIRDNTVKRNGETGIELNLGRTKLKIRGNKISSNDTSGLAIQAYNARPGKIRMRSNSIRKNDGFGIRYARFDRGKIDTDFYQFIRKCVRLNKNKIKYNDKGSFSYS